MICAVEDCGYSSLWDEYVYQCRTTVHCPVFVLFAADLVTRMKLGFSYFDVDCVKALKRNTRPVLFIHGTEDTFVPFEMLLKNYNATAGEKEMLVVPDAIHARCSSKNPELYWNTFFAESLQSISTMSSASSLVFLKTSLNRVRSAFPNMSISSSLV